MSEFVNYKMAMKLKEKGFPQHMCDDGYITEEDDKYDIGDKEMIWLIPDYLPYIAAPIVSQVLKWLRDEKGIHITICVCGDGWFYEVINISSGKSLVEDYEDDMIQSYEEAALAGIEYVLNNLI